MTKHIENFPGTNESRRSTGRGLSIVEVMISLTITSFLLVAVATAYNASASAIEMNDRFFRATQAGRVTMNQLLTEIRRADWVGCAPTSDYVLITRPVASRMPEEDTREYRYTAATKKITLKIAFKRADGTVYYSPEYSLASNVESATFGPPDQILDATSTLQDVRIPVNLNVKIGSNQVRLSGSSGPRRLAAN